MLRFLRSSYLRRYLRYNAVRRGLLGQSRFWLVVFGAGLLGRGIGRITKSGEAPVLFSEELPQGESYLISHLPPPPTRRQRRKGATR